MKLLVEVGDKVVAYNFPDNTTMQINSPMHGWIEMVVERRGEAVGDRNWFRMDRVIALVTSEFET